MHTECTSFLRCCHCLQDNFTDLWFYKPTFKMSYTESLVEFKERIIQLEQDVLSLREMLSQTSSRISQSSSRISQSSSRVVEIGQYRVVDGFKVGFWELGPCTSGKGITLFDREKVRSHYHNVVFERTFQGIPKIYLSITTIDTANRELRIEVTAEEITDKGFKLGVKTWWNSEVYGIAVHWLAYFEP